MKVGFLNVVYSKYGGTETFYTTLIPRLKHEVVGMVSLSPPEGPPVCPIGHGRRAAKTLAARVDVLVTWGITNLEHYLPKEDRPIIIAVHHGDTSSKWAASCIESVKDVVDHVVCVHPDVPGIYIPNGVDPARCFGTMDLPEELVGKTIVLWVGRMSSEKNPIKASRVADYLPDNWKLVMLGEGYCKNKLNPKVYAPGFQDPGPWYSIAHRFLHTADQEGFGLSIGEAMYAGVPVVSTPVGVAQEAPCTLININASPREWAAALLRPEKGVEECIKYIESMYTVDHFAKRWNDLFTQLEPKCKHIGKFVGMLGCGCDGAPNIYECGVFGKTVLQDTPKRLEEQDFVATCQNCTAKTIRKPIEDKSFFLQSN